MFGLGELAIILIVVILVLGAKRLPDLARSAGKSARILKSEAKAMKKDDDKSAPAAEQTADATAQQPAAPRTIQAFPGDVTGARPVNEPNRTTQS